MRCVVTGAAGFVGSHLCEALLHRGHTVVGVDCFAPHYPAARKAENQQVVLAHPHYHFHAADLRRDPLAELVEAADVVFHLAAAPVGTDFDECWMCNVQGTHRLLEAVRAVGRLRRFVLASSAGVYGRFAAGNETTPPRPLSPYAVTKLAAEHLCQAHAEAHDLPLTVLRYFGVYGPRQRPDMAVYRFIQALLTGDPIEVYGDGRSVRGFTDVSDCVAATIAVIEAPPGETYNVGGDEPVSVLDLIQKLEAIAGRRTELTFRPARTDDLQHAVADTAKIRRHLGWRPRIRLDDGLARQWAWQSDADVSRPAIVS